MHFRYHGNITMRIENHNDSDNVDYYKNPKTLINPWPTFNFPLDKYYHTLARDICWFYQIFFFSVCKRNYWEIQSVGSTPGQLFSQLRSKSVPHSVSSTLSQFHTRSVVQSVSSKPGQSQSVSSSVSQFHTQSVSSTPGQFFSQSVPQSVSSTRSVPHPVNSTTRQFHTRSVPHPVSSTASQMG